MKKYKVWIQIEKVDENKDEYENGSEPEELAAFSSKEGADAFVIGLMRLLDASQKRMRLKKAMPAEDFKANSRQPLYAYLS